LTNAVSLSRTGSYRKGKDTVLL